MAYSQTQTNWLFVVTMLEGKFPKNEESEWIFQICLKYKQKQHFSLQFSMSGNLYNMCQANKIQAFEQLVLKRETHLLEK